MLVGLICMLLSCGASLAQDMTTSALESVLSARADQAIGTLHTAPVVVNGEELFDLIGIATYPAKSRVKKVSRRIENLAKDADFDPGSLRIVEREKHHEIIGKDPEDPVVAVFDEDAAIQGLSRDLVIGTYRKKIARVITEWRYDRLPEVQRQNTIRALVLVLGLLLAIFLITRGFRLADRLMDKHIKGQIMDLEAKSLRIIQGEQLWKLFYSVLKFIRTVILLVLSYLVINAVLKLFPETRYAAHNLIGYVTTPLKNMGAAVLNYIPSLIFLILLYLVTRYLLKVLYQFFAAIHRRRMEFSNFDAEWAFPTYRIVRVVVILFALVIAYPYIPGSQSEAFKGLSIMLGVLFSLGSSSVISNVIAGYTMTYRRAFRVGDRVTIGNTTGDVTEMRVLVTHVRSLKNEEVVIPNSTILNNDVINYSRMVDEKGLILYTSVGIGYEVPWRQVEAMLIMAADRTEGLLKEPEPFVLQKQLTDFAVIYEINAYCRDEKRANAIYTALHQNIQDVFNEYEVQIMTPNYRDDTEDAKIVPRDQWFAEPATPPELPDAAAGQSSSKPA